MSPFLYLLGAVALVAFAACGLAVLLHWLVTTIENAETKTAEAQDTAELEMLRKRVINLREIALRGKAHDN